MGCYFVSIKQSVILNETMALLVWGNTQRLISEESGILMLNSQDCVGEITFAHNHRMGCKGLSSSSSSNAIIVILKHINKSNI